ncbi:hypothetical protein IK112_02725 [Candidatus Saccharibacteria bacterium]|nr:hypothetical protein [Candidatus Saccharibacteria bacterium]
MLSGRYYWNNGDLAVQGAHGFWWATTAFGNNDSYHLRIYDGVLDSQDVNSKNLGIPLRQIAQRRVNP